LTETFSKVILAPRPASSTSAPCSSGTTSTSTARSRDHRKQFFSGVERDHRLHLRPAGLRAGFAVRPFGALVFGRLGDLVGRKYTFLVTIVLMGLSTFAGRLLPTYASDRRRGTDPADRAAPAAGPGAGRRVRRRGDLRRRARAAGKRGLYTSWIQTTATLGLFLSLLVILGVLRLWPAGAFEAWGWRIPFLLSIAAARHLGVDPAAAERVAGVPADEGRGQDLAAPLRESFARGRT
jgi:MFS family permease